MLATTGACTGVGALIGWAAGSAALGALGGVVAGIPASIFVVYRRYRGSLVMARVFETPRPVPSRLVPPSSRAGR